MMFLPARPRKHLLLGTLLAVAAACNDSVYSATDPEVRVATRVVWAGAEIVLTSTDFIGADTLPLVILGDDTLPSRYAPRDSVFVVAPQRQGTFQLWVGFRGRLPLPFGEVAVGGGYRGTRLVPLIGGYPLRWPGGPRATFLIAVPGGLASVDPNSGIATSVLPDSIFSQNCYNGPGPAPGGRVTVAGRTAFTCGPLLSLRPDAPAFPPDTGPSAGSGYRFAAELGPDRWLIFSHHRVDSWSRAPDRTWTSVMYWYGEPNDVVMSPTRGLAVPIGANSRGEGVPVFSAASVGPAYRLSGFSVLWGAQFTDDGDTLYVAGVPSDTAAGQTVVLAVVRASDGEVLRSAPVWSGVCSIVLDPMQPWLYLVGYTDGWAIATQVLDRRTLVPIASLTAPTSSGPGVLYPMLDAIRRRLYVVDSCPWCTTGYATPVTTFDLLR